MNQTIEEFGAILKAWRDKSPEQKQAEIIAQHEARGEVYLIPGPDGSWVPGSETSRRNAEAATSAERVAQDPTDLRVAMLAELCPYGSGPCGCGDGPPRSCSHPDRPSEVRKADCLACAARQWWQDQVETIT